MASQHIEHKLSLLPDLPGCYLMKDINFKIIYVGKAKNLKNRVRSYFKSAHEGKTAHLVSEIVDFETIVTSSDKEAFLLEITLIQKHKPYYNIKLKQGTGYPYIKITNERDPKSEITSYIKKDGGYYFGPYPNVYAAQETLHFIQKVYPLRRCSGNLSRPCLYFHMGQCLGACFKEVPRKEYDEQIKHIKSFLNGNVTEVKKKLTTEMEQAATELRFERAGEIRDQLHYIEVTVEKQKIISNDHTPRDIFNFYVDKGWMSIQIFFLRQTKLLKREKRLFALANDNDPIDEFSSFLLQFYNQKNHILPKEVLVPQGLENSTISEIIQTPVSTPSRGQKFALMNMAQENAQLVLEEKFRLLELDNRKTRGAQEELFAALKIAYGHTIEAFDHSHIQGTDPVSAMVVYTDGEPDKSNYRKFKLKGEYEHQKGADEAANTREIIRRRYTRLLKEKSELPSLILMDGGAIEVNAAKDVLINELGLAIPIAGMVKNNKHKTAELIYGEPLDVVELDSKSQAFYLIQRVQDEVHRFAITFHRQSRSKNALSSKLESISGIGPKTRTKLLKEFGSMKKIKDASVTDLQAAGLTLPQAQTLKLTL